MALSDLSEIMWKVYRCIYCHMYMLVVEVVAIVIS